MEFYKMLSEHYEQIFPLNSKVVEMVESVTPAGGRVLDVGCAKGELVRELFSRGYDSVGLEYVEELVGFPEKTLVGDMHKVPYTEEEFDTLVCTGNTLVHSFDIGKVLGEFSRVLKKGGRVVIQILNYDRIMSARPEFLPEIKFGDNSFVRKYLYRDGCIEFIGELTVGGKTVSSSVELNPICFSELKDIMNDNGLRVESVYGGFDLSAFNENSYATVLIGERF